MTLERLRDLRVDAALYLSKLPISNRAWWALAGLSISIAVRPIQTLGLIGYVLEQAGRALTPRAEGLANHLVSAFPKGYMGCATRCALGALGLLAGVKVSVSKQILHARYVHSALKEEFFSRLNEARRGRVSVEGFDFGLGLPEIKVRKVGFKLSNPRTILVVAEADNLAELSEDEGVEEIPDKIDPVIFRRVLTLRDDGSAVDIEIPGNDPCPLEKTRYTGLGAAWADLIKEFIKQFIKWHIQESKKLN